MTWALKMWNLNNKKLKKLVPFLIQHKCIKEEMYTHHTTCSINVYPSLSSYSTNVYPS